MCSESFDNLRTRPHTQKLKYHHPSSSIETFKFQILDTLLQISSLHTYVQYSKHILVPVQPTTKRQYTGDYFIVTLHFWSVTSQPSGDIRQGTTTSKFNFFPKIVPHWWSPLFLNLLFVFPLVPLMLLSSFPVGDIATLWSYLSSNDNNQFLKCCSKNRSTLIIATSFLNLIDVVPYIVWRTVWHCRTAVQVVPMARR